LHDLAAGDGGYAGNVTFSSRESVSMSAPCSNLGPAHGGAASSSCHQGTTCASGLAGTDASVPADGADGGDGGDGPDGTEASPNGRRGGHGGAGGSVTASGGGAGGSGGDCCN